MDVIGQKSAQQWRVAAPAKLNLRLKVEGRREDGYHLLRMQNAALELADRLSIRLSQDAGDAERPLRLVLSWAADSAVGTSSLPLDSSNSIFRVYEFLQSRQSAPKLRSPHWAKGAALRIAVSKHIPSGSGLGGGSSDAAAFLRWWAAMCEVSLEELQEDRQFLLHLANEVGADIPYFLFGGFAEVSGIGERVRKLPGKILQLPEVFLLVPREQASTRAVYARYHHLAALDSPAAPPHGGHEVSSFAALPEGIAADSKESYKNFLRHIENDLLPAAQREVPQIQKILLAFAEQSESLASLTGSGSTVFVLPRELPSCDSSDSGRRMQELVQKKAQELGCTCIRTRFLPRLPPIEALR